MKAVILSLSPNVEVVDITHEVEKFNVRTGAYVLASAAPYFPKGTIHVAIVDPSVGTERQPILIQTGDGYFIGPDNGVLALAARNTEGREHVRRIVNKKLMMSRVSNTFHGRDIFAPAAAHLANGISPEEFGPEISEILMPEFAKIIRRKDMLVGEVIHVDDFGNIVTSFGKKEIGFMESKRTINLKLRNTELRLRFCKAYGEVDRRKPLALIGSHDFLEISINQGSAAKVFKIKSGDKVTLYCS
jgi:hypothetical protein